ncbi:hypothetical protein N0V88_008105 [Collariella sp. IMI 366227]|nr:hypothetical protein N0V88_008105 [Collariella sp. IMI 366227]
MQLNILLILITAVIALPASDDNVEAASAIDVSIQATHKWQTVRSCKTDWNTRDHQQCIGEAKTKGFTCKD